MTEHVAHVPLYTARPTIDPAQRHALANVRRELHHTLSNLLRTATTTAELRQFLFNTIKSFPPMRSYFQTATGKPANYEMSLFGILIRQHPAKMVPFFLEFPALWVEFFTTNEESVTKWFDHFGHSKSLYGAFSLERFAFRNRDWFWDAYLIWTKDKYATPVSASFKKHVLQKLDVHKTLKGNGGMSFWASDEWKDSLESGEILLLDPAFFAQKLETFAQEASVHERLVVLMDQFISECDYSALCDLLLHLLPEDNLLSMLVELGNVDGDVEDEVARYLLSQTTQLGLNQIMLWNLLLAENRTYAVRTITNHLDIHLQMQASLQVPQDEATYWALKQELQETGLGGLEPIQFLLMEAFIAQFRLSQHLLQFENDRVTQRAVLEETMKREGIEYQIMEKSKKDKKVFVGWIVPLPSVAHPSKKRKREDVLVSRDALLPPMLATILQLRLYQEFR